VDTPSRLFLSRFELLGTDAPKMAMTTRSIVERIDVVGHGVVPPVALSVGLLDVNVLVALLVWNNAPRSVGHLGG
jgi:hypothetical protein